MVKMVGYKHTNTVLIFNTKFYCNTTVSCWIAE